jgi:hypothetical protein
MITQGDQKYIPTDQCPIISVMVISSEHSFMKQLPNNETNMGIGRFSTTKLVMMTYKPDYNSSRYRSLLHYKNQVWPPLDHIRDRGRENNEQLTVLYLDKRFTVTMKTKTENVSKLFLTIQQTIKFYKADHNLNLHHSEHYKLHNGIQLWDPNHIHKNMTATERYTYYLSDQLKGKVTHCLSSNPF